MPDEGLGAKTRGIAAKDAQRRGRKPAPPGLSQRDHRRTRAEFDDARSSTVRRGVPGAGRERGGVVLAYVAFDPETFDQIRNLAAARQGSFASEVRRLAEAGLAIAGQSVQPAPRRARASWGPAGGTPARGATRRRDVMPFSNVGFDRPTFDAVRALAAKAGVSLAEQVRQLVEWGLEG